MSAPAADAALEAFGLRVRQALVAPGGSSLAAMFPAALVSALIVDASELASGPWLERALLEVRDALERVGVPRGRQFVLLGRADDPPDEPDAPRSRAPAPLSKRGVPEELRGRAMDLRSRAAVLGDNLSLTVLAHDAIGAGFSPGWLPTGDPIELDDELREAEAIVCVGRGYAAPGRVHGGPYLLVPGVASLATRGTLMDRRARAGERGSLEFALAAEALAPVDLALTWDEAGNVTAGSGREHFAALARAAGFA